MADPNSTRDPNRRAPLDTLPKGWRIAVPLEDLTWGALRLLAELGQPDDAPVEYEWTDDYPPRPTDIVLRGKD